MRRALPAIAAASALALLASCATVRTDGDAVECSECRALWIRLFAASSAPGLYLLDGKEGKSPPCPRCGELAVRFFESGVLPRRCSGCGGNLQPRAVNLVR